MNRLLLACLFLCVLTACGRRADPRPPEATAPAELTSFSVRGEVNGVRFMWLPPEEKADGNELDDLVGFRVERNVFVAGERPSFEEIAFIQSVPKADTDSEQVVSVQPVEFLDTNVTPGAIYDYRVIPVNERGTEGEFPGIARVTFVGQSSVIELRSLRREDSSAS